MTFRWPHLNFNHILLKLADQGSIPRDTLQSQDGLNLGDIHFCPILQTFHMEHISLDCLWRLIAEGTFMSPMLEGTPKLSGTTAILLIYQADDQHEKIIDVYVGLVVHCVKSRLYAPDQILNFVSDIEVTLKVAHDALKARVTQVRGMPFAFFSTAMEVQCPSPWTRLTASSIP